MTAESASAALSTTDEAVQRTFSDMLSDGTNKSTGLAAIETLMWCLSRSKGTGPCKASASSYRLQLRFHSKRIGAIPALHLAHQRRTVQGPVFESIMQAYKTRGETFVQRIAKSRKIISRFARPFIRSGMKLLVHSYSRVVLEALLDAKAAGESFEVFVTESRPDEAGRKMHDALLEVGVSSTVILDGAIGYLMERVDAVLFGAEGVVETGGIINKIGTLSIALAAKAMNKPVYVLAESIKFVREYPLNQGDIPDRFKYRSSMLRAKQPLEQVHPLTDYTPPQFINLLVTDLGIFTPAAVGDELIKLYT
ncbi:initiation factor 2 subunit family protein [Aphelenchoides avenae]|nr:initiation factor 2 subunit family protein [Aphelenchus avenae]